MYIRNLFGGGTNERSTERYRRDVLRRLNNDERCLSTVIIIDPVFLTHQSGRSQASHWSCLRAQMMLAKSFHFDSELWVANAVSVCVCVLAFGANGKRKAKTRFDCSQPSPAQHTTATNTQRIDDERFEHFRYFKFMDNLLGCVRRE